MSGAEHALGTSCGRHRAPGEIKHEHATRLEQPTPERERHRSSIHQRFPRDRNRARHRARSRTWTSGRLTSGRTRKFDVQWPGELNKERPINDAVAESFFGSLKKERIKKHIYKNRELAFNDVADYIETFYNRTRRHSHLGGLSPEQFEAAQKQRPLGVH